ncbi:hypothetical protein PENTCL1PPCAC_18403, partial [Pristionchus entomophagus]
IVAGTFLLSISAKSTRRMLIPALDLPPSVRTSTQQAWTFKIPVSSSSKTMARSRPSLSMSWIRRPPSSSVVRPRKTS